MDKYGWVLLLCLVILIVAVVTLSVLRFGKKRVDTVMLSPPFSQLFTQMRNTDSIALTSDKPLRITSGSVVAPTRVAFVVNDNTTQVQVMVSSNLIGFIFTSSRPITITSFQILATCVAATRNVPRNLAIYEFDSQMVLAQSVVNPNTDYIDTNGFYTAALPQPLELKADTQYVLVAQSLPLDVLPLRTPTTDVRFTPPITFVDGAQSNGTSTIAFPNARSATTPVFASFQFRETTVDMGTVFQVDASNGGFASSPPQYMNGFISNVPASGNVIIVGPGAACDSTTNVSIVLTQPAKIRAGLTGLNGLDAGSLVENTWYYVYVVSSDQAALPTACLLSLDRITPQRMPDGYVHYRRIGSVRTNSTTTFFSMQQENMGRRRTTFFLGDADLRNFVTGGLESPVFLTAQVPFVPPTATIISIGVRGLEHSFDQPPREFPINGIVDFHPAADEKTTVTLGIPDDYTMYGQIDMPLNNAVLPQTVAYKMFPKPGTGGSIPNSEIPPFIFEQYRIDCTVVKYVEIL